MPKNCVVHGPALPVVLLCVGAAGALAPATAFAACTDAANIRTCVPPDPVARDHAFTPIDTLLLQGGAGAGSTLLAPDGLSFTNPTGPGDLTLNATGFVDLTSTVAGNDALVLVSNDYGLNNVLLGQNVRLVSTLEKFGIWNRSLGNVNGTAVSLTQIDGIVDLQSAIAENGVYVTLESLSSGLAHVDLLSHANVTVVSGIDGVRGVGAYGQDSFSSSVTIDLAAGSAVSVLGTRSYAVDADSLGNATVNSQGNITATGDNGTLAYAGIHVKSFAGAATANVGGVITMLAGSGIAGESYGIFANSFSTTENATINFSGSLTAEGEGVIGLRAWQFADGDAVINAQGSTININAVVSRAIEALATNGDAVVVTGDVQIAGLGRTAVSASSDAGSASIDSRNGSIVTTGDGVNGLAATGPAGATVLAGNVSTSGNDANGLYATSVGGAILLNSSSGAISTQGDRSEAVLLELANGPATVTTGTLSTAGVDSTALHLRNATGTGSIAVDTRSGLISTQAVGTYGIWLESGDADAVLNLGAINTAGVGADAARLISATGDITAIAEGAITAAGNESRGIVVSSEPATAPSGVLSLNVLGSVNAAGQDSVGIFAQSTFAAVSVTLGAAGSVLGGWDADPAVVSTLSRANGAGIVLGAGPAALATLTNAGSISAWSDQALRVIAGSGAVQIGNSGTINGSFALSGLDDVFANTAGGVWAGRNFVDTDRGTNPGRDTKRIAVADFGLGTDVVRNEATASIRVATVTAPLVTETAGQYLPNGLAVANYLTSTAGVEQLQLTRLERFENRGAIVMSDLDTGGTAAVAGDIFIVTSGSIAADGTLTAGAAPAVFLSDGGTLRLDTVLNQGGAASHSDLLVTDSVQLGPNGPTRIFVTNAGGLGASTQGSGIKLVEVLGGATLSAANAFVLGSTVVGGAFTYNLFQSSPLSNDGDWYLRTDPAPQPPQPPTVPQPPPPPPPPPPPGPPPVAYRPEASLFSALPGFMRGLDAAAPGSRQARLGDEAVAGGVARRGRAWARLVTQDIDTTQSGTVSPAVNGSVNGLQFGVELYGGKDEDSAQIGAYLGQIKGEATVSGYANGVVGAPVGRLEPQSTYAGVYVSRSRGAGFYFDAVLQYAMYRGDALNLTDGVVAEIKGRGAYASLETGYGFGVGLGLVLEPQLQIVAQPQRLGDIAILNAGVTQSAANTVNGRAGLRLKGTFGAGRASFRPYVRASVWQGLSHSDRTNFTGGAATTTLFTRTEARTGEFGAGLTVLMGSRFTAFAEATKIVTMDKEADMTQEGTAASLGLRFAW